MSDPFEGRLPTGELLEQAIEQAKAGALSADGFVDALAVSTLMLAVVEREDGDDHDEVAPFVIELDSRPVGVAFTSPRQWDTFTAETPFILLDGADLGSSWPAGLGLVLNPASSPTMLLHADQLAGLFAAARSGPTTVPAGSELRVGAPDPGLPPDALDSLRRAVRADPAVQAVYQLAVAVGDAAPELAVGVEAVPPYSGVAEGFADSVARVDPGFGRVAFLDLDGATLASAKQYSAPLS